MFHKILVAIDHSDFSQAIFEEALNLANVNHAKLMLLHVLAPFNNSYPTAPYTAPYMGIALPEMNVYWEDWRERERLGLEKLQSLEKDAIAVGVSTEFTQSFGDPGSLICSLAKTWDADLIVIGRRGLSGIGEFFMGSVSNYVLHNTSCNVLVIQSISDSKQ